MRFNPPPNWPLPRAGWTPPIDWIPDSSLPQMPEGWQLWLPEENTSDPEDPAREADDSEAIETARVDTSPAESAAEPAGNTSDDVLALKVRVAELEHLLHAQDIEGESVHRLDHQAMMLEGVYEYRHPLDDVVAYESRLREVKRAKTELVKSNQAVVSSTKFTWNGSLVQGQKLTRDLSVLMLSLYNSEVQACVRRIRNGHLDPSLKHLERTRQKIFRCGKHMQLEISQPYHDVCITELELVADHKAKKAEARETERRQREERKEQEKLEQEIAELRAKLDKEEAHYLEALAQVEARGDQHEAEKLQQRLANIQASREKADYWEANNQAGYVYVISNVGSFGPNMVKIGLTRRLDPRDRVRELSSASVPFRFDVHAMYFTENARKLEAELHAHFADRQVNHVTSRKEFFFATPHEVLEVMREKAGSLLEFHAIPEAEEYWQSLKSWPVHVTTGTTRMPATPHSPETIDLPREETRHRNGPNMAGR